MHSVRDTMKPPSKAGEGEKESLKNMHKKAASISFA
jgi:hypothetical protein